MPIWAVVRTLLDVSASLASRYRPHRLADVVGQRHATSVLKRAIEAGTLPQQMLFSGGSGLGKTTLARCVASALLCENRTNSDACGECESCKDISTPGRIHPDVVEFDAASNGQKEQIKELASRAATTPVRGAHRVYIIDEAHGLSLGGGQAFLKLLEEPPPHVVFMLATTDPEKMLRTNRGRCIEFELSRPTDDELAAHLCAVARLEGWDVSDELAQAVISATDPALGLRGLLMTLEKLSDTLSWGVPPTAQEVAALLGLPPSAAVDRVVGAIDTHDRKGVLGALIDARITSSDAALRRALITVFRNRLYDTGSPLAAWRFEQLVCAPQGPLQTEVVCCKLAAPELDQNIAALSAHAEEATARLSSLAGLLATTTAEYFKKRPEPVPLTASRTPTTTLPSANQEAHGALDVSSRIEKVVSPNTLADSATHSNIKPPAKQDAHKPVLENRRTPVVLQPQPLAEKPALVAPSQMAAGATSVEDFLNELGVRKESAAKAAVKAAGPTMRNGSIVLDPPTPALRKRLEDHRETIKAVAVALGVKVTITRS